MPAGFHTGKNISHQKRQAIITAIAHGEGKVATAKRLHTSDHIVNLVIREEWRELAKRKEILASQAEHNALIAGNQIAEALAKRAYSPSALVPVYGVSLDKAIALRSDPTIHVEHSHQHIHAHITESSYHDLLAKLRAKKSGNQASPQALQDKPKG